jgi:hypothetical protein
MGGLVLECYFYDPHHRAGSRRKSCPLVSAGPADQRWQGLVTRTEEIVDVLKPDFFIIRSVFSKGIKVLYDSREQPLCAEALQSKSAPILERATQLANTGEFKDDLEIIAALNREKLLTTPIREAAIPANFRNYLKCVCLRARKEDLDAVRS